MALFNHASTEVYREATAGQLWLDHRHKHCGCGKRITAKQLTQYGACSACFKAGQSSINSNSAASQQDGSDARQGEQA